MEKYFSKVKGLLVELYNYEIYQVSRFANANAIALVKLESANETNLAKLVLVRSSILHSSWSKISWT